MYSRKTLGGVQHSTVQHERARHVELHVMVSNLDGEVAPAAIPVLQEVGVDEHPLQVVRDALLELSDEAIAVEVSYPLRYSLAVASVELLGALSILELVRCDAEEVLLGLACRHCEAPLAHPLRLKFGG